jgi:hypothetical protein
MALAFNAQNWDLILSTTRVGNSANGGRFFSIPDFSAGLQFESGICAVTASSSSIPDRWRLAGYASLKVFSGLTVGGNSDAICAQSKFFFDKNIILIGPPVASNFALEFAIAGWIPSLTVTAWAYTGAREGI